MYKITKYCRLCLSKNLKVAFKFSSMPLGEKYFKSKKKAINQKKFPQSIGWCPQCNNVQVQEIINLNLLWQNYTYLSSQTKAIINHFKDFSSNIIEKFKLTNKDLVIDIGSNDGSLLKEFKKNKINVLGIEPARNIAKIAKKNGVNTINDFFGLKLSKHLKKKYNQAKVITCFNTFAHSEKLREIVHGVKNTLASDGIFIFECQYLADIYKNKILGTFFHEHLYHHSVTSLKKLFESYNMELFDVKKTNIQKGSIIGFASNKNSFKICKNVNLFLKKENYIGLKNFKLLKNFKRYIDDQKDKCSKILNNKKLIIAAFGSARSGPTLAFNFGINKRLKAIFDDHPLKINKHSTLNGLPVYPTKKLNELMPDVCVILAYLHSKKIIEKNIKYLKNGGNFLLIYPKPKLINFKNFRKYI
jgi:2-polyprenyl-3-methyl-5-hydroxy-6-metoxy-1,4-benzoquinol methylase